MSQAQQQHIPLPYGDAFLVGTPNMDRVGAMMINDEKVRAAQQAQQAQALDNEFAKNVAGIKDVDVPELTQGWSEYKAAKQNVLRNGSKMKDPDRIAADLEAQRKLGKVYQLIAASKKAKQDEDEYAKDAIKNPNEYVEDVHGELIKRRNTPTSQLIATGYNNLDDKIRYKKGSTIFKNDFDSAVGYNGKPIKIGESEPTLLEGGLQYQKKSYMGMPKTAPEIAANFLQSVVGSKKTADLVKEHTELNDPNVLAAIDSDYDKLINSDIYKAAYKNKPAADFPSWMNNSPQGKIAMYLAKQAAINNAPQELLEKPYNKLDAVLDRKEDWWKTQQGIRQADKLKAMDYGAYIRERYKDASEDKKSAAVDEFIDKEEADGVPLRNSMFGRAGSGGKEIKASPIIKDIFSKTDAKGHKIYPNSIIMLPNGKFKLTGDGFDDEFTREEYKAVLTNKIFNTPTKISQIPNQGKANKATPNQSSQSGTIKTKVGMFNNIQ